MKTMKINKKQLENLKKGKRFTSEYQPSPEAKKRGWEEKRIGDEIMNLLIKYYKTPMSKIKKMLKKMEVNSDEFTPMEIKSVKHVLKDNFFENFLNIVVRRLPVRVESDISLNNDNVKETFNKLQELINKENDNKTNS